MLRCTDTESVFIYSNVILILSNPVLGGGKLGGKQYI